MAANAERIELFHDFNPDIRITGGGLFLWIYVSGDHPATYQVSTHINEHDEPVGFEIKAGSAAGEWESHTILTYSYGSGQSSVTPEGQDIGQVVSDVLRGLEVYDFFLQLSPDDLNYVTGKAWINKGSETGLSLYWYGAFVQIRNELVGMQSETESTQPEISR